MEFLVVSLVVLILICLLGLSWFAGSDAPYVTTDNLVIKKLLSEIGLKKGQFFYELGSGDGRVVFQAAAMGAKAIGVEQSWIRVWYSRFLAYRRGVKNTFFIHGNIFERNYFPADIVYIFLLPEALEKLEKKLKSELKPKSIVITQTFHFPNWKPFKKIDLTHNNERRLGNDKYAGDFWVYIKK